MGPCPGRGQDGSTSEHLQRGDHLPGSRLRGAARLAEQQQLLVRGHHRRRQIVRERRDGQSIGSPNSLQVTTIVVQVYFTTATIYTILEFESDGRCKF